MNMLDLSSESLNKEKDFNELTLVKNKNKIYLLIILLI
jgi:hypothetical protein